MKKFVIWLAVAVSLVSTACNEDNSTSIMQALASSQEKSDKVWSQAEIICGSANAGEVDYVAMIANDGLYVVASGADQDDSDFLKKPTVGNNDAGLGVSGIIRNLYVPGNYVSSSDAASHPDGVECLVAQTVSDKFGESGHYYAVSLADWADMDESSVTLLSLDRGDWEFVSRSQVSGSSLVMLKRPNDGGFRYAVANFKVALGSEKKLSFNVLKEFDASTGFSTFWEDDRNNPNALVLFSTSGDDVKEQEYYSVLLDGSSEAVHQQKLSELSIRFFIVYDDASFMALTQSGTVIHSGSSKSRLYTSDSSFSYDRYTVPVVFMRDVEKSEPGSDPAEPDVTIFARYSGNGFIVHSYNREINDNRIRNRDYSGHVQTSSYATNLRSEDISEMKGVTLSGADGRSYRVLVLSTENGISTFKFDSTLPPDMKTNGVEVQNKVDVF